MKKTALSLLFLLLTLNAVPESLLGQGRPAQPVSPEVHADKTVTFRYNAPNAETVAISAEFLDGRESLTKNDAGLWSVTLGPVEPDLYPYFFIVDGVQVADPNNALLFPNERFNRSLVDIPGDTPLSHAMREVPHGAISYRHYQSESLDLTRPVVVYTPPGYDTNTDMEYPVLYLIHGMTDTYETWFKVGHVNLILDNLIADGLAEPMIVVMPYANPYPALLEKNRDTPVNLMGTDMFTTEMLEEVIPFTEENYRVIEDAGSRAIAGFSLGGRQTLAAGLGHPEVFSWVAAFAPAIFGNEIEENFSSVYAPAETLDNDLNLLWISCGTDDGLYNASVELTSILEDMGIEHETLFTDGGHTWMNVRDYMTEVALRLFQ